MANKDKYIGTFFYRYLLIISYCYILRIKILGFEKLACPWDKNYHPNQRDSNK